MAYVYNGKTRAITLTVDFKDSDGTSITGYPKDYAITDAFTDPGAPLGQPGTSVAYSAISNVQLARMSYPLYQKRLEAFYNMIEAENPPLDRTQNLIPGYEPTGTSTSCPIGGVGTETPSPIV